MTDRHAHSHRSSDRSAAFTGLIVGAILLGATLFTIVTLTNQHYERLEAAAAAPAAKPA